MMPHVHHSRCHSVRVFCGREGTEQSVGNLITARPSHLLSSSPTFVYSISRVICPPSASYCKGCVIDPNTVLYCTLT